MQFLTLRITLNYGLLQFNYSILIPYRMTACTRSRKSILVHASLHLSCTRFENGIEGNSRCERFQWKRRKLSKSINILNEAVDILRSPCMSSCNSFITWRTSHTPTTSMMFASLQVDGQKTYKAKQKGCEELAPWIQSISNRLWWCKGNQRWECAASAWKVEVLDHVGNKHEWSGNTLFHQCRSGTK